MPPPLAPMKLLARLRTLGVRSALLLALLLMTIGLLAIAVVGWSTADNSTERTIGFAVTGALLQTAFLGVVYEVWLRKDVEESTLKKLKLSRDVIDHGLVGLSSSPVIDWQAFLASSRKVLIATVDPSKVVGLSEGNLAEFNTKFGTRSLRIAVPSSSWDVTEPWRTAFGRKWRNSAGSGELYFVALDDDLPYEIVASESAIHLLLPPSRSDFGEPGPRMLTFEPHGAHNGIGAWIGRQVSDLERVPASLAVLPEEPDDAKEVELPLSAENHPAERLT